MAGNQLTGDSLSANLAGMSKNQLYEIMSQMKTLIEQNQDQARQILIQNPLLTKALFQAQIMLGMVQPPQAIPNIQAAASQQATQPVQQSKVQAPPLPVQSSLRDQTSAPIPIKTQQQSQPPAPVPSSSAPPLNPSLPLHSLQSPQLPRGHLSAQTVIPLPQSSQVSNMAALPLHSATQPSAVLQPPMPAASAPLQHPLHTSGISHLQLQPPLPSQPRPPSAQALSHQNYSHMGPTAGYQHPSAPQMHHSQPMFHSGSRPPTNMTPQFSQGQQLLQNQPLSQTLYQGGHIGMDFNQLGSSAQVERGTGWMPGLTESAAGTQLPGPSPPFLPGQMNSGSQPSRGPLTPDAEKALLQQVMNLTPEQINQLPPGQRTQVLQLQQLLRQ